MEGSIPANSSRSFVTRHRHSGRSYGIHIYPGRKPRQLFSGRVRSIPRFLPDRGNRQVLLGHRMGDRKQGALLPGGRSIAREAIHVHARDLRRTDRGRRLTAAYYYDWDTEPSYSLCACASSVPLRRGDRTRRGRRRQARCGLDRSGRMKGIILAGGAGEPGCTRDDLGFEATAPCP